MILISSLSSQKPKFIVYLTNPKITYKGLLSFTLFGSIEIDLHSDNFLSIRVIAWPKATLGGVILS